MAGEWVRLSLTGRVPLDSALSCGSVSGVVTALREGCGDESPSNVHTSALQGLARLLVNGNLGRVELAAVADTTGLTHIRFRAAVIDAPPGALRYLATACGVDVARAPDSVWQGVNYVVLSLEHGGPVGFAMEWEDAELVAPLVDQLTGAAWSDLQVLRKDAAHCIYRLDMRGGKGTLCLTGLNAGAVAALGELNLSVQTLPGDWASIGTSDAGIVPVAIEVPIASESRLPGPAVIRLQATGRDRLRRLAGARS